MKKTLLFGISMLGCFAMAQTYNNGGLSTGSTSKSGVAAPAGYTWSEAQNNTGNTTESNTSAGYSGSYVSSVNNFFIADDFTIPPGSNWQINSIDFFAYQSGYTGTASPFNTARVNIFKGDPSFAGSASVFGDDVTNRFASSEDAKMYRLFNSSVPAPGSATGTTRKIWKIRANIGKILTPGTYWIKYQLQNITSTANFLPSVTIPGSRGLASFNAKQLNAVTGVWSSLVDDGDPVSAPDYTVDMPFVITFTSTNMGVNEIVQYDNRVQVYPNPVKNSFKINNPDKLKIESLEIIDASGKTVKTLNAAEQYDVSTLPKGIYFIKIKNEGIIKITKLIKE